MSEPRKGLDLVLQHFPAKNLANNSVYIDEFTYGNPEIKSWGEKSILQIGKFCSIADKVTIFLGGEHRSDWVSTYPFSTFLNEYSYIEGQPKSKGNVIIGNDVWIASGVTILSGVTIGDGAIIGCNSLVSKYVSPYAIVGGNPAKVIRYRFEENIIKELLEIKWWNWQLQDIEKAVPLLANSDIETFISYCKNLKSGILQK